MRLTSKWLLPLLLVSFAGLVLAAEPRTYPAEGAQTFLGLDDTSAPTAGQDGRASDLQNVNFDISRALFQRHGYELVGATLDIAFEDNCAVTGLYYTKFSTGTERNVATCGNRFAYLNGSSWSTVTGSNVSITAGQNNQFVWATAYDEIIGTNGVDAPLRYDGTTLANVNFSSLSATGILTTANTTAFYKNFLIFGNTTEGGVRYKTRVRWSDVGDTASYDDDNYVDIGALSGQEITGMAQLYDNLYVFLTDSIYRMSFVAGADTFNFSKVSDTIGCIAKNSVQAITLSNAQQGLVWLAKNKRVYFFDGITVKDISTLITNSLGGLSASRLQYAVSAASATDYYLCATNGAGGTNNLCHVLQHQIGEWTKHTHIDANAMAAVLDSNKVPQVFFGNYESFVYALEDPTLDSDVGTVSGIVSAFQTYDTSTTSGLQVMYLTGAQSMVTGSLVGAPVEILDGVGAGSTSYVAYNTVSGIVVTDRFTTTGILSTLINVGRINSFYTTVWSNLGDPARLKAFFELYFWAEANQGDNLTITHATDLSENVLSQEVSMSSDASDAVWGSGIWGVSLWGSDADIFRKAKLSGKGRYLRVKFTEDDANETFKLYGRKYLLQDGSVN